MTKSDNNEMTFLEHLEELRWHIVRSVLAVMSVAIVAFVFKSVVFDIIIMGPSKSDFFTTRQLCKFGNWFYNFMLEHNHPFGSPDTLCLNKEAISIQSIQMAGQFLAHIKISIISGVVLAFPYIVWEFWRFFKPALYANEKKYAKGAVLGISFLFTLGVMFGYFIISPLSVNFLYNYQTSDQIVNNIQLMSYVSIVASIALASGVLFELPAIILFLSKLGVITPEFLKKYRRHALIVMLLVSAIITPPDVFSQILVCLPLIVLYEISIKISKRINKKIQNSLSTLD